MFWTMEEGVTQGEAGALHAQLNTVLAKKERPNVQACLEHRHSFVRRNAVLAINALYKLPKGELLLQDAPELIEKVLQVGECLLAK